MLLTSAPLSDRRPTLPLRPKYLFRQPLKHKVYARSMTIAAGFTCNNGVLLCADTEETGWAMTIHASKLGDFRCPVGKIAFAYAGHTIFARSAIQHCERELQDLTNPSDLVPTLEGILDREYRRTVLSHPDHATDGTIPYQLLLVLVKAGEPPEFFVTAQQAMSHVDGYECIGMGNYLAHYLVRPLFSRRRDERFVYTLAAYMLANVKGYVPDTGGTSEFLMVRSDGTLIKQVAWVNQEPFSGIEWLERQSKYYEKLARTLLFQLVDPAIGDDTFDECVEEFVKRITDIRSKWRKGKHGHESFVEMLKDLSGTDLGQ